MDTAHAAQTTVKAEISRMLAAAVAEFEAELTIGPDGSGRLSATGEEFVACTQFGRRAEATPSGLSPTAEHAIDAWKKAATSIFDRDDGSVLYWRVRPEIEYFPPSRRGAAGWRIYSRFLISSKPQIEEV
jgi:hypothetical protein